MAVVAVVAAVVAAVVVGLMAGGASNNVVGHRAVVDHRRNRTRVVEGAGAREGEGRMSQGEAAVAEGVVAVGGVLRLVGVGREARPFHCQTGSLPRRRWAQSVGTGRCRFFVSCGTISRCWAKRQRSIGIGMKHIMPPSGVPHRDLGQDRRGR